MERGPSVVGLRMDIGPLGNEVLDNIDVLVECRIEQRRSSSVVVLRIDVGSFFNEILNRVEDEGTRCVFVQYSAQMQECGLTVFCDQFVGLSPVYGKQVCEIRDHLRVPCFLGDVRRCLALFVFRLEIGALSNEAFDDIGVSAFRRPV